MSARGEALLQAGKPRAALAAFRAEAKTAPDNPSIWLRVADCSFLSGDAKGAAKAAGKAHDLGGSEDCLRRHLQALLLAGDERAAAKILSGMPGAEAEFWRAVLACRAGKWAEARRRFLGAAGTDAARLAERAGLLAAWAGHRAASGKLPARRGLVVAGLGWKRPRQATVGALDALSGCERIVAVANTLDDATKDVLCLFRAKISAVAFRGTETEALKAAKTALTAARKGPAGTVTRGNPLVYGRFAAKVVELSRKHGIRLEIRPGVSAYEGLATAAVPADGTPLGLEVRGVHDLASEDGRAMIVFTPRSAAKATPPKRAALWLGSEGGQENPARIGAAEAADMIRRGGNPGMLYYLSALLLAVSVSASAAAPSFKADPRLEFVGMVELASGGKAKRFTDPKDEYAKAARAFLAPYAEHPALKLQAGFPKAFDFVAKCDIADRLTPGFEATTSYFLPDPTVMLAGGRDKVEPWLEALRGLAETSYFPEFFAKNRAALEARAEPFRKAAEDAKVLAAIEEYAGRKFDGTYEVTVSPFFDEEKMLNSVWPLPGGARELRTAFAASAGRRNPDYFFQERLPASLWHQLAHGYFDARVEAARDALAERTDGRRESCFGAWEQCVKENVVRAVTARLLALKVSEKASKRFLKDGDEEFYPRLPELLERLEEYEKSRDKYPTLDSYLPVLFEAFPKAEKK